MEKRGIYYIGRLISAQKGIIFENDHYEKIRKVYSIWIRSNVTKDMKNTVTVYNLTENDIIGARKAKKEDYDLICMVMIGLGDHEDVQPGTMLKMLDVLFSKQLETKDKKDLLEAQCGIPMKEERIKEEVETMCSLGQGIYQEGLEQGLEQGIELINQLNQILLSEGKYDELQKASKDKEYQKRLLAEYGLLNEKQGE